MKNIILGICLLGIMFAQVGSVTSPSDGFSYTIREVVRNMNVFFTDTFSDEIAQTKVRMEIQRELYYEMNKELQLGNSIAQLETNELRIRNEIQTRIQLVEAGNDTTKQTRLRTELQTHEQLMTQQQSQLQTQLQTKSQSSIQAMETTSEQAKTQQGVGGQ